MASTRIKGRQLRLTFDGVDYWADQTAVTLENEEADEDTTTFEDAAAAGGARQYFLNITAIQSTDTDSFWRLCWDRTGDDVPFAYAPHGNTTPTADRPHFTGTATIGARPTIGGEAGRDVTYTFETRFDVDGVPLLDVGAPPA